MSLSTTYSPDDFKRAAGGNITQDMFPDEDLDALISAWIDKGEELSSGITTQSRFDLAIFNYVYWQCYLSLFVDLSQQPSTIGFQDQANESWTLGQIKNFGDLAKEYEGLFLNLIAEVSSDLANAPRSRNVQNSYNW